MLSHAARALLFPSRALSCVFNGATVDAVDRTTYTFAAQQLNRPSNNRIIVVAFHSEDALSNYSLSSMTITPTGQSAIAAKAASSQASGPAVKSGIWFARVPVAWEASIALTFSEGITACGISVYSIYGILADKNLITLAGGAEPTLCPVSSINQNTTDATSLAIGHYGPCVVIGAASNAASGDRCTWTGIDEMYDQDISTEAGMTGGFMVYGGGGVVEPIADFTTGTTVGASAAVFY